MNRNAILGCAAAIVVAASRPQPPPFKAGVDLVEVDAAVVDRSGRTVTGLRQQDFQIREDGRPVKIVTFAALTQGQQAAQAQPQELAALDHSRGRFLVLLLDDVFIGPVRTTKIREIARQFIDKMNASDVIGVIKLNGAHSTATTGKEQALTALNEYSRERPPSPSTAEEFYSRADHAMDTIADLARQLADVRHRRKAIVFIGAPVMFVPTLRPRGYSPSWYGALRELARANVAAYYIDPRGLVNEVGDAASAEPAPLGRLRLIAGGEVFDHAIAFTGQSGGVAFVNSNFFDRAVDEIWRETGDYYLLGYEPPVLDDKVHSIVVQVGRRGVSVRARKAR